MSPGDAAGPADPDDAGIGAALRWPAEWEPHTATWLAWPHNPETWPGHLAEARREYAEIVRALQGRETLRILLADAAMEASARELLRRSGIDPDAGIQFLHVPSDDSWIRDWGPIFVHGAGPGALPAPPRSFGFDAWGGKYPPWDRDAVAARRALRQLGVTPVEPGFVLEGGSIEGNGAGCVLTTESCLLNPNRERGRTREQMETRLGRWLGARHVVWLEAGIEGDDTDGHIDDVARFATASTVVAVVNEDPAADDHAVLESNRRRLAAARDQDGKPLEVVALPSPPVHRRAGHRCPASYANFYLANGVALVPTFGAPSDERALAVLRELWRDREVLGIPCSTLVLGLGAIHCLSQQEPRAPDGGCLLPDTPGASPAP